MPQVLRVLEHFFVDFQKTQTTQKIEREKVF